MATISKEVFESNKPQITTWVSQMLLKVTNEEQDGMLVDYITLMLSNGKTAADMGDDLVALVGNDIAAQASTL